MPSYDRLKGGIPYPRVPFKDKNDELMGDNMSTFWESWNNWAPSIPLEEVIHPDSWHIFDDLKLCEQAANLFRHDPRAKDGIRFECFNKKEADKLKDIMDRLYPDVKTYFSYPKPPNETDQNLT